jgi:hypothetical protein
MRAGATRRSGTWAELGEVKAAFAQYYYVGHGLLAQELLRLGQPGQLTQARYADGLVPQRDVVRARSRRPRCAANC